MTRTEDLVWSIWNALDDDERMRPVHTIAALLDMDPADVAFIIYPAETFGPWSPDQEP